MSGLPPLVLAPADRQRLLRAHVPRAARVLRSGHGRGGCGRLPLCDALGRRRRPGTLPSHGRLCRCRPGRTARQRRRRAGPTKRLPHRPPPRGELRRRVALARPRASLPRGGMAQDGGARRASGAVGGGGARAGALGRGRDCRAAPRPPRRRPRLRVSLRPQRRGPPHRLWIGLLRRRVGERAERGRRARGSGVRGRRGGLAPASLPAGRGGDAIAGWESGGGDSVCLACDLGGRAA
mmetsp:Transcript_28997/g.90720  ORF Transcript_28997/g.90720 Transcript_28997/m.90720 type:complete len:237 (+) Transcript_28997:428-1138(+)